MEVWIVLLVVVAGLSGWAGYFWASRNAPKRAEFDALAAELDEARRSADSVQENVDEHFEQSARLFGKLAGDYREFLEHLAGSAQTLGLSESRTRELVEQSFQPLLTHEVDDLVVAAQPDAPAEEPEAASEDPQPVRVAEVTLPETTDDVAQQATATTDDTPAATDDDTLAASDDTTAATEDGTDDSTGKVPTVDVRADVRAS